jgi:hypothetical protein
MGSEEVRAASVLMAQFETVMFARAQFAVRGPGEKVSSLDPIRGPISYALTSLDSAGRDASAALLKASEAAFVGAKDFRSPSGPPPNLGGVRSTLCYVFVLRKNGTFDAHERLNRAATSDAPADPVWKWQVPHQEGEPGPVSFYAAQVARAYFVVSNSLGDLQTVAKALASKATGEPQGIRDWAALQQRDAWGYRRYRHGAVKDRLAAGMEDVRPGAEALVLLPNVKSSTLTQRLLGSPGAEATVTNINAHQLPFAPLKSAGAGAWETTFPVIQQDEQTATSLLAVMHLFGFGVYL